MRRSWIALQYYFRSNFSSFPSFILLEAKPNHVTLITKYITMSTQKKISLSCCSLPIIYNHSNVLYYAMLWLPRTLSLSGVSLSIWIHSIYFNKTYHQNNFLSADLGDVPSPISLKDSRRREVFSVGILTDSCNACRFCTVFLSLCTISSYFLYCEVLRAGSTFC